MAAQTTPTATLSRVDWPGLSFFVTTAAPARIDRRQQTTDFEESLRVCATSVDYLSPGFSCQTDQTCSNIQSTYFGCCYTNTYYYDTECPGIYSTCYPSSEASSCPPADAGCIACTDTSSPECITTLLYPSSGASDALTKFGCALHPDQTEHYTNPWPTTPSISTQAVVCVQESFAAEHQSSCATATGIILPLILSNVVYLCVNALAGRHKFQRSSRLPGIFSSSPGERPEDYRWRPWSGLSSAVVVVLQAVATGVLIRAAGYEASLTDLVLLWLARPRMMWSQMLWHVVFGKQYKGSATDAYFADHLVNCLSIPFLVQLIIVGNSNGDLCGIDNSLQDVVREGNTVKARAFGSWEETEAVQLLAYIYLGGAASYIPFFAFFLYKPMLGRWWSILPTFWSVMIFAYAWSFWVLWVLMTDGVFCLGNLATVAVIHALFPLLGILVRVLISNTSYPVKE